MLKSLLEWLAFDALWLLPSLLLLIGSALIYRRFRQAPAFVQFLGALAYFLYLALSTFTHYMGSYVLNHPESHFARAIYPTDTVRPALNITSAVLQLFSICFPVGFVWFAVRVARRI